MKDYIKEKLLSLANNDYMKKYIEICEFYQKTPTKIKQSQFHHIIPAFILKEEENAKNRSKVIDKLDKDFPPEDNVVLVPGKFHLILHYELGKALMTKDAINAFQIFIGDYRRDINDYTIEEVKQIGSDFQDTLCPIKDMHYISPKEKEKLIKEEQKAQHKVYLKQKQEKVNERKNLKKQEVEN